ncbi:MAG: CoA pyrophosphatase [Alphaproteobacteria bacterium]|nr:CoA pyrophosphatase [Alphaproteobacteria bacterium]
MPTGSGSLLDYAMSPGALRERALDRLHKAPPAPHSDGPGDDDLNAGWNEAVPLPPLRPAAVLIAVVARDVPSVILTLRTAHLSSHAGQIAFPGGKLDEGETVVETALREAEEEIGLASEFVEPLGFLDLYKTRTGFEVSPMVAMIRPGFELVANPNEVEDVFEVPLAFLLDEANHLTHSRVWQGKDRYFYAIPYRERYIWGATAGIIRNFHRKLTFV